MNQGSDSARVLEGLNPLRQPGLETIDLLADVLAAASVGLGLAAVLAAAALLLTRRARSLDPRLVRAEALPRAYRLPAYLRLLGASTDGDGLYQPMTAAEQRQRTAEARARLDAEGRAA